MVFSLSHSFISRLWHILCSTSKARSSTTSFVPVQSNKNAYTALKKTTWKFDIGKIRNKFAFHVLHAAFSFFWTLTPSVSLARSLHFMFDNFLVGFWWLKTFIISSLLDASAVAASSCSQYYFFFISLVFQISFMRLLKKCCFAFRRRNSQTFQ